MRFYDILKAPEKLAIDTLEKFIDELLDKCDSSATYERACFAECIRDVMANNLPKFHTSQADDAQEASLEALLEIVTEEYYNYVTIE